MSQNTTPSFLDSPQIIKRVYEEADDAVRVKVASGTSFAVALDAADGDSVKAYTYDGAGTAINKGQAVMASSMPVVIASNQSSISTTDTPASSSTKASVTTGTGTVLSATSCVGMKSFNLYSNTTTTVVNGQVLTLEVSPSDTDNVWKATTLTITPSGTVSTVVMGTANSAIVGRRVRVTTAAAIDSGAYDLYLVMQGA